MCLTCHLSTYLFVLNARRYQIMRPLLCYGIQTRISIIAHRVASGGAMAQ
jgi:hypothetical protein